MRQESDAVTTDAPALDVHASVGRRIDDLVEWLSEHAPRCDSEQAHLRAGSPERVYWHYGYLIALRDLQRLMAGQVSPPGRPY
jgi:hypothetical protein